MTAFFICLISSRSFFSQSGVYKSLLITIEGTWKQKNIESLEK